MNIHFTQQKNTEDNLYDQAIEIYIDSFPPNERQCLDVIKHRINQGTSELYIGLLRDEVVSIGLLWDFKGSEFVLLDYMAVKKKYRNMGIGSLFVQFAKHIVHERNKTIFLESEHPGFGENKDERKKRILFYIRNGLLVLDKFIYMLPPLDNKTPTQMILMISSGTSENMLSHQSVHNLILNLYNELYGRNAEDALLNSFIHLLPLKITLSKSIPYDIH